MPGRIRDERLQDYEAIREINRQAFRGEYEAVLVDRLREEGLVLASLVYEEDAAVLGHILFSRLPVDTATGEIEAVALAPVAVRPEYQSRGIGSSLDPARIGVLPGMRRAYRCRAWPSGLLPPLWVFGHSGATPRSVVCGRVTGTVRYPAAFGV